MTDTCVCCPIYRPAAAHPPTTAPVCDPCRWRLHRDAFAIARLDVDLTASAPLETDQRLAEILDDDGNPTGTYRWADPAAALLPAGAVAARSGQPLVSGTREASTPIDIDTIDLTAPARLTTVHDPNHDQIGHISAATMLTSWAHAFRATLFPTHARPEPTVYALVRWLTTGAPTSRLDTACTHYPAIDVFAGELRQLCAAMHGAAGETEPPRQVLWGVPCRNCHKVTLLRDGDYIECETCHLLLTEPEYRTWTATAALTFATPAPDDQAAAQEPGTETTDPPTTGADGVTAPVDGTTTPLP